MIRAGVAMGIALLALACGGATTTTASEHGEPAEAGASDAASDADAAFTIRSGAKCCAEGTGRSCCAPDESFLTCAAYGGPYDHCSAAGAPFPAKVPCALCCPGTQTIAMAMVAPNGTCTFGAGDALRCAPCGDGLCDPSVGENRCSCPQDCPAR